jgi:colanic acid biosynthesis glycosyl transferase WcaI
MGAEQAGLRMLILTHYFPPEIGAPQARMQELAQRFAAGGDTVTVLTGLPNYPTGVVPEGYRGRFSMVEKMSGVTVLRRWVYAAPNAGFFKRIVNHLSFAVTSLTALRKVGKVEVMFVESPPLLLGLSALAFSWLKRAPFVLNVSDIWPQSAIELGALRNPLAIRLAEALEHRLYRKSARVTVPTRGMHARLSARVAPPGKVVLLTNGVDVDLYRPQPPDRDLARRLGLEGRKVILYAGTHGLAQGLGVVLDAARLTDDPDILYVLAGEGADKAALVARAASERLANVRFLPNQPKASMPSLLNLAYAAVITLRPLDIFKAALPSKMFESMAIARPIVGSVWGEAAELIEQAGCGLVAVPGDAVALRDAVVTLAADPDGAGEMGRRGRDYVVEHFNRAKIASRLRELLVEAARPFDEARV